MGKYYSLDLRERIVHAVEGGMSRRGAVRGVSASMDLVWKFFDRHDVSFKKNAARKRAAARGR